MLVMTNAFGWVAPFSVWFIVIPAVLFVGLMVWEVLDRESTEWGFAGHLAMASFVAGMLITMVYLIFGHAIHWDVLKKDISEQTSISSIEWGRDHSLIGKNTKGEFTTCVFTRTDVPNLVKVLCDK